MVLLFFLFNIDGDLHGLCNVDSDCVDDHVECKNQRCECIDGYRDIDGTCQQGITLDTKINIII